MSQQPDPNNPYPTEPHGAPAPAPAPAPADLSDSFEDAAGGAMAQWKKLGVPIQAGVAVGAVILLVTFARYIIPALLAAVGFGALIALLFVPYWLPTIVAFVRKHPSKAAIFMVNFFFGWTFIGWIISLIWAISNPGGGNQSVVVNVSNSAAAVGPMAAPQPYAQGYAPQPAFGQAPPQAAVGQGSQQYRVGDVVNGHRFDGVNWIPVPAPGQQPPPAQIPPPGQQPPSV